MCVLLIPMPWYGDHWLLRDLGLYGRDNITVTMVLLSREANCVCTATQHSYYNLDIRSYLRWRQMKLTPWHRVLLKKLRVRSAIQEIPPILLNPKVHHRVHNNPPPVPILSQMNPIHISKPYLPKIHPNVILPSTPRSS
jgi:hypothetical protein